MLRSHATIALIAGALIVSCKGVTTPGQEADPITVTIDPDVVELLVGETRQLNATVTGGAAGTARTVTYETSNVNIASVEANGLVRGVGPGSAQVTARSTADPSATDVAQVTVEPLPVVLSIERITVGGTMTPVDPANVFGQIDVHVSVEPGGTGRVDVVVDQQPGCSTPSAADRPAGTSAQVEIVCSINTSGFNAQSGAATFPNGPHSLSARVVGPTGTVVTSTSQTQLVFNNQNFVSVRTREKPCITAVNPQSLANGAQWCSGDVIFDVIGVNYGGPALASGTVTLTSSGNGVTGAAGCRPTDDVATDPTVASTHGGAGGATFPGCPFVILSRPFTITGSLGSVSFPANVGPQDNGLALAEDVFNVSVSLQNAGGLPGPTCINPDPIVNPAGPGCTANLPPIRVDNLAPRVTQLNILRPNQYFNSSFAPSHTAGSGGSCTAPCARSVDYGVNSQTATFLAGPPGNLVNVTSGFGPLPETATANTNVFQLTTADALANTRTAYATNVAARTTTTPAQAQGFGIDNTKPIATITSGPPNGSTNCPLPPSNPASCAGSIGWVVSFSDAGVGPSGFNASASRVKLERITGSGVTCLDPPSGVPISCTTNNGFVPYNGSPSLYPIDGFYRLSANVTDNAENVGDIVFRISLHDYFGPGASYTIVGNIAGGTAQFDIDASDNVAIGDVRSFYGFNGFNDIVGGVATISPFDVSQLISRLQNRVNVTGFIKSIETTSPAGLPTGTVRQTQTFGITLRDVAGVALSDPCPPSGAADGSSTPHCILRRLNVTNALAGNTFPAYSALNGLNTANPAHGLFVHDAPSQATVCTRDDGSCQPAGTAVTVDFIANLTGPANTFTSPFQRVFFMRSVPSGRWEPIGNATATTSDNAGTRSVAYRITWNPDNVPAGPTLIRAVGVDANGSALVSEQRTVTVIN